jgi:hypothetical protein
MVPLRQAPISNSRARQARVISVESRMSSNSRELGYFLI